MHTDPTYELLRLFASPVIAITSSWRGRTNGMIADSAVRASISPTVPRLSVYIHKWHFSHDLIWNSGRLCIHLLNQTNLELVHALGFVSGRDQDKLSAVPHHIGASGLPVLDGTHAAFELEVINTMDTGYATHFLGDITASEQPAPGEIMTAAWFRANLPEPWKPAWRENYRQAQAYIDSHATIEARHWTGSVQP